eukprot:g7431.t1
MNVDPEGGADGRQGESGLEAAIAASRRAEAKSAQELQLELEAVRLRLLRRSQIIDVLRSAYVRDVVMIKNELMRKSAMTDEEYTAQGGPGTEITDAIPSLDMRPVLALFSPEDAFLRIESCSGCGGHLEIVTKETKRVARLTKRISDLNEQMGETAKEAAHLRAELILTRHRVKELDERNIVNRDTLVAKLEQTQRDCEAEVLALKDDAHRSNRAWESKIARKARETDEQLAVIPVLHEERDMLREALSEERASREEDLHNKDGEIATLQAKVADLEASAEADAKVLVEARNKADEIQRRLKSEKAEHSATTGLLEEERARYERCRARLETSQEHLADLNERFNELRAEVECSAENAEDEAGQASDALASAKMEIQRLRAVLGTNDAAAALETATLKVSSLSEELHAARSEAREANDALREVQEELLKAQEELEKNGKLPLPMAASMRSDSSRQSDGGLSWAGSFVGSIKEDDFEDYGERQDRMSSAMVPGSGKFEKGKWAVEKWIALVRFRKAVNAHTLEVTRLQHLLKIAQGGEERSRLTSELESSRFSLDSMEDAMHMEVAALKLQATGNSGISGGEGEGGGSGAKAGSAEGNSENDAAWEKRLVANTKASDEKLAIVTARHNEMVEGLQAQLNKQREDIDRLEEEAMDTKERLKKLAKLEKNEKGHNAMTEELKKMEEETGLSVGLDSSLEFTSIEGDLSREDEARLIEELNNARDEIKNIKMRQASFRLSCPPVDVKLSARILESVVEGCETQHAMVTHELLGTIKGANAEVDMLKAALIDMTAQRDARMDMNTLAAMGGGSGMSAADVEEFQTLKEEAKVHKKKTAALQAGMQETSDALLGLLDEIRKASKETIRAKAKVWNVRDLERLRSLPPSPKPSVIGGGRVSMAIQRLSAASGRGGGGTGGGDSSRKMSRMGVQNGNLPSTPDGSVGRAAGDAPRSRDTESVEGTSALVGRVGAVKVVAAPFEDEAGGGAGRDGGKDGGGVKSASDGGTKEGELERRRRERAAQIEAKKKLAEDEQQELEEFQEACLAPESEGVAYAVEKMGEAQANVKEQFKEVFLELKQSLEMHKKFVMRTRVEAREVNGKMAALEIELQRLRELQNSTEEQLRGRTAALAQTQQELNTEKSAGAATRRELTAARTEAHDNIYFKEKNAVLQKQLDLAEITSRRAKQDSEKAKRELREQAATLMEFRKLAEESERRQNAFSVAEDALKGEVEKLKHRLEEAESAAERMEQAQRTRLETLISTSTQVNGYDDPDLGLGVQGSTQTEFHSPLMTLRRSNNRGTFPTRASSAGVVGASNPPTREGCLGGGAYSRGPSGFVCPAVDGRAIAAERDLYSPGSGSAAFLEAQDSAMVHSLSNGTAQFDVHSESLRQLSFRSPAWAMAAPELSVCEGSSGSSVAIGTVAGGREATFKTAGRVKDHQQRYVGPGSQAKHWGLWHESEGTDGEWDDTVGSGADAEPAESPGPEARQDDSPALEAASKRAHGGGVGMPRPGTTSACSPNPNTPRQSHRPQTSPPKVLVPCRQDGNDDAGGGRVACRSPPQRMQSRLFLQSAMDLSLSPTGLAGGGRSGDDGEWGEPRQQRRPGVTSAVDVSRRGLNSASCSDLPPAGTRGFGRGLPGNRPSTSSAALSSNRQSGGDGNAGEKGSMGGRPASRGGISALDASDGPGADGQLPVAPGSPHAGYGHQVIDLGVVSDATPRPRVWGEQQLAAAAAAAAGRTRNEGVGAGIRTGVTRGGVVLDARLAKVRKTLRRDVLEAAERARLPLLQA